MHAHTNTISHVTHTCTSTISHTTHTHTCAHTYTLLLSHILSLSLSHTHTYTHSLSLSHTHSHSLTHTHAHTLSLSHTHTLSLTHTHTLLFILPPCYWHRVFFTVPVSTDLDLHLNHVVLGRILGILHHLVQQNSLDLKVTELADVATAQYWLLGKQTLLSNHLHQNRAWGMGVCRKYTTFFMYMVAFIKHKEWRSQLSSG